MRYRVITANINGEISVMTDWATRAHCRSYILSRWGHWPPFAYVSQIAYHDKLKRKYGFAV